MNAVVLVAGKGQLADFVSEELSAKHEIIRLYDLGSEWPESTVQGSVRLALVLHDGWEPADLRKTELIFQQAGIPWLPGFVSFGEGIVGPLVRPGTPGCSQCADMRRLMGGRDRMEMRQLHDRLAERGGQGADAWASRSGLWQLASVVASEAERVLEGREAETEGRVFLINLSTLASSRHAFLPDPMCMVCGSLPDDTPELARIQLQPSPKVNANSYRCRPMSDLQEVLVRDYLDYRTGLMNGKMVDLVSPFADMSVNLPMMNGHEATAGRTHSYAESVLTAILEGLERHCGIMPRGKRTVVHDSYSRLAEHALNPLAVGVHTKEQYAQPGFPFEPFDAERPMNWVWGYSFRQERPILVPERLAYYSLSCGDGFVYETSNGCALGGSLEEAIFYAIMEVVERDSFLMTWYAQLPLPRLDPSSAQDQELQLMIERLRAMAGFEVHLFNATMENGIPSIWAIGKNRKGKGVNLICAAGAHPDPVRAARSAVHELSGLMLTLDEKFENNRERIERMFEDPTLVQEMDDHSMLNALPQAEERLRFLMDESRPLHPFAEQFKPLVKHPDLTDDLKDVLHKFLDLGMDVIVVDQTAPETKRNELHCVKVLIPGMLPMTFGYHLTRLVGLGRVLQVPAVLGYTQEPLTPEQLNPHPHPFP